MEDHHRESMVRNPADRGSKSNQDINPGQEELQKATRYLGTQISMQHWVAMSR